VIADLPIVRQARQATSEERKRLEAEAEAARIAQEEAEAARIAQEEAEAAAQKEQEVAQQKEQVPEPELESDSKPLLEPTAAELVVEVSLDGDFDTVPAKDTSERTQYDNQLGQDIEGYLRARKERMLTSGRFVLDRSSWSVRCEAFNRRYQQTRP